jgi:hypothetical protein
MSIEAVRASFVAAAKGRLQLHECTLRYIDGDLQVLGITGWHAADNKPFAIASAAFAGDPCMRAAELAEDIALAHTGNPQGTRHMPAPAPIKGLAATLREHLKAATDRANASALKAKDSVSNLHGVLDTVDGVITEVDAAAADIQSAVGESTNGGPLGPLSA